jgi:iron(III) transport system ATP-binding protein
VLQFEPEAVHVRSLTKKFGSITAVNDVDLDISAGSFTTLLGPSGCGKTTLLRLIAGLEEPTEGRIMIGDRDVTQMQPNKRNTIMVFQSYALFPHMTVGENVGYGLRLARKNPREIANDVREALALMNMDGLEKRYIGELSGGQQQRVALARAIVLKPRVLLFDEPLSNLDAKLRKRMRLELRALQQKLRITSVYVTHDQVEALAMSDTVVVMSDGIAEQVGSPRQVYDHPRTPFVADFIGEANLIPCRIACSSEGIEVITETTTFNLPAREQSFDWESGSSGLLMIRPESVILSRDQKSALAAEIVESVYLGNYIEYLARADGLSMRVHDYHNTDKQCAIGDRVFLSLRTKDLHFIPH